MQIAALVKIAFIEFIVRAQKAGVHSRSTDGADGSRRYTMAGNDAGTKAERRARLRRERSIKQVNVK